MAEKWRLCRWGDIATLEYGKGLSGYENGIGPYPVYGTNGQIGYHTEPLCDRPSVIIGRKGAYRGIHFSKLPFFVIDTAFYLKPKRVFNNESANGGFRASFPKFWRCRPVCEWSAALRAKSSEKQG